MNAAWLPKPWHAQIMPMAALGMVAMIGAVAIVIDWGMFYVIQRELQNAADAAAVAAVWYSPACDQVDSTYTYGCKASPTSDVIAAQYAAANAGLAGYLCDGPDSAAGVIPPPQTQAFGPYHLTDGSNSSGFSVTLTCDAHHWFGRIFPDLQQLKFRIAVHAAATIGWADGNASPPGSGPLIGSVIPPNVQQPMLLCGQPQPPSPPDNYCLVARLIL